MDHIEENPADVDTRARTETAHFVISGEFLTNLVRTLWADEEEPEKALAILEAAFPDMSKAIQMAVILGEKKLTGDSDTGIEVEDDNARVSQFGNELGVTPVMKRFRKKIDEGEDFRQIATNNTELIPSPEGLIEVPRRRTTLYPKTGFGTAPGLKEGVNLKNIPYRAVFAEGYPMISDVPRAFEESPEPSELPEELPESLPVALDKIEGGNGWLTPEGKFYPCEYTGHLSLLGQLLAPDNVEKLGWLKVQQGEIYGGWEDDFVPTQAQLNIVFDYCTGIGKEFPSWFKRDKLPELFKD